MQAESSHVDRLERAFGRHELRALVDLMDERVVWRGLDQPGEHAPLCHDRSEVEAVYRAALARGVDGDPRIVDHHGDSVVVEPRPIPARPDIDLHQVVTFRADRIVLIQDFPDRHSAVDAIRG